MSSVLYELERFFDRYETACTDDESDQAILEEDDIGLPCMEASVGWIELEKIKMRLRIQGHALSRHAQRNGRVVEETAEELGELIRCSICNPSLATLLVQLVIKPDRKAQCVFVKDRKQELSYLICITPEAIVVRTIFDYSRERLFYKPNDRCFLVNANGCARMIRGNDSGFVKKAYK